MKLRIEYSMEMMHALFPRGRIPAAIIHRRSHPALHQLNDPLVLIFDRVEQCTRTLARKLSIGHIAPVEHPGFGGGNGDDNVERKPPGIEVEHHVGKQPQVVGCNVFTSIRMTFR